MFNENHCEGIENMGISEIGSQIKELHILK